VRRHQLLILLLLSGIPIRAVWAQPQPINKGPFDWINDCGDSSQDHTQVTVTLSADPQALPGLYKWDYEIHSISVCSGCPGGSQAPHGIASFGVELPQAVPDLDNVTSSAGAPVCSDPTQPGFQWSRVDYGTCPWPVCGTLYCVYPACSAPASEIPVGGTAHFQFTTEPRLVDQGSGGFSDWGYSCVTKLWKPRSLGELAWLSSRVSDGGLGIRLACSGRRRRLVGGVGAAMDLAQSACAVAGGDFPVAAPGWRLAVRAGLGEGPSDTNNSPQVKVLDHTAVDNQGRLPVTLPLGAKFWLQLVTVDPDNPNSYKALQAVSQFKLSDDAKPDPAVQDSLFPNNVVIEYAADTAENFKYFQAVHLGTVTLTITPTDKSALPVTLAITINQPASLGTTYLQYDPRIIDLANARGIPPQFIKGQIKRESNPAKPFDPNSWRYEPISWDFSIISTGQDLRLQDPYQDYRLAARPSGGDGPLAQGPLTLPADIAPRAALRTCPHGPIPQPGFVGPFPPWVCADGLIALAPPTDTPPHYISALNFLVANPLQNWLDYNNPAKCTSVRANCLRVYPGRDLLDFTAQTDLAASCGLLQMGYITAISRPIAWHGVGGRKNPSYLFDTDANLAAGGGTLGIGTVYLRKTCFPKANPEVDIAGPEFDSYDGDAGFRMAYQKAFNVYNHNATNDQNQYGSTIVSTNAAQYMPVPTGPIFQ